MTSIICINYPLKLCKHGFLSGRGILWQWDHVTDTYKNSLLRLKQVTDWRRSLHDVNHLIDTVHCWMTCHPTTECLRELRLILSHTQHRRLQYTVYTVWQSLSVCTAMCWLSTQSTSESSVSHAACIMNYLLFINLTLYMLSKITHSVHINTNLYHISHRFQVSRTA